MEAAAGHKRAYNIIVPTYNECLNVALVVYLIFKHLTSCSYDSHMEMEPCRLPEFNLWTGIAKLQILFQDVYTETRSLRSGDDDGGGERVLCMVGDAVIPMRSSNSTDPWDWAKNRGGGSSNLELPVVSNGNILLLLCYPMTPTLTGRAVHGVMMSTKASLMAPTSTPSTWCPSFPAGTGNAMEHHRLNRGSSPCDIIYQLIPNNQVMEAIPNWNCKGTDEFCSRLCVLYFLNGLTFFHNYAWII